MSISNISSYFVSDLTSAEYFRLNEVSHLIKYIYWLNRFKPEFTIVISIHYKPWIAVAIPDL